MGDEEGDPEVRLFLWTEFGTMTRSMLSMFEITMAPGGWRRYRRLYDDVSPLVCFFIVFYVCVVTFAVMRVISAIFLKETLSEAAKDQELVLEEKMRQKQEYITRLKHVFTHADQDGTGNISMDEFHEMLSDDRVNLWLSELEVEVTEVDGLFQLMDTGDGQVSFDEFMSGLMRIRGSAKGVDLVTLLYESRKILHRVGRIEEFPRNASFRGWTDRFRRSSGT